jgi:hypothetical protein
METRVLDVAFMRESAPHHCCRVLLRSSLFLSRVGRQQALPIHSSAFALASLALCQRTGVDAAMAARPSSLSPRGSSPSTLLRPSQPPQRVRSASLNSPTIPPGPAVVGVDPPPVTVAARRGARGRATEGHLGPSCAVPWVRAGSPLAALPPPASFPLPPSAKPPAPTNSLFSTVRKKKKDPRVRGKQVQGVFYTVIDSYE